MKAERIRVCRPYDRQAMVTRWALFGIAAGTAFCALFCTPAWRGLVQVYGAGQEETVTALWFALPFVFAWRFCRLCQNPFLVYLSGQVFCTSYVLTSETLRKLVGPNFGLDLSLQWGAIALSKAIAIGAIGGVTNLAIRQFNVLFRFVILEQDGALCDQCGYRIGPARSSRCPECGTKVPSQRPAVAVGQRWRGVIKLSALVVLLALIVIPPSSINQRTTIAQFIRQFRYSPDVFGGTIVTDNPPPYQQPYEPPYEWWEAVGTYREIRATKRNVVLIVLIATDRDAPVPVQLRLGSLQRGPDGSLVPYDGDPWVRCDLSREQASMILGGDIPQSIIDELARIADEKTWAPAPYGSSTTKPIVTVPAEPHFSKP